MRTNTNYINRRLKRRRDLQRALMLVDKGSRTIRRIFVTAL